MTVGPIRLNRPPCYLTISGQIVTSYSNYFHLYHSPLLTSTHKVKPVLARAPSSTTKIANKICKIIGILNKLKHFLPQHILSSIYTSLIKPHLNFGILLWGHEATRIYKLQKKVKRTLSMSKYNAHTEPFFKKLQFINLNDIFKLQQLTFYYKHIKSDLPKYFNTFLTYTILKFVITTLEERVLYIYSQSHSWLCTKTHPAQLDTDNQ